MLVPFGKQIYDLSVDALSPMYYFLLPSSKIRDATFLFNEEGKNIIVIMSSAGYMYTQVMDESSSAQHGPFYVTNVLEITHEDLKVTRIWHELMLWQGCCLNGLQQGCQMYDLRATFGPQYNYIWPLITDVFSYVSY